MGVTTFNFQNLDFVDELVVNIFEGCNKIVAPLVCETLEPKLYQVAGGLTNGSKTR